MVKKYFILFIVILVVVYIGLALLDLKSEYLAEKLIFSANTTLTRIGQNPQTTPPGMYKRLVRDYQRIIDKFPKAQTTKRARVLLGQAYILKEDFSKAREELAGIFKDYPEDKELCSQAQFQIGKSYEKENKWPEALLQYEKLIQDYGATTHQGLYAPLYIALYYQNNKMTQEAEDAFGKALEYYKKLAVENPKTSLGYTALTNIFAVYMNEKKLTEAAGALEDLIINYPMHPQMPGNLQAFNFICLVQLKDPMRAMAFYERFIQQNPKNPMVGAIEKQIEVLKEKSSAVKPILKESK